jgi:hypothetical protein
MMLNELSKSFEKFEEIQKVVIQKIPDDQSDLKVNVIRDMNSLKEAMKTGDIEKITEIQKNYASSNRQ